ERALAVETAAGDGAVHHDVAHVRVAVRLASGGRSHMEDRATLAALPIGLPERVLAPRGTMERVELARRQVEILDERDLVRAVHERETVVVRTRLVAGHATRLHERPVRDRDAPVLADDAAVAAKLRWDLLLPPR